MSDNKQQPATNQQAAPNMDIRAQYIRDFSFENPNAPEIFQNAQKVPNISIRVDVASRRLQDNAFETVLTVHTEAKVESTVMFITEVSYAGIFNLTNVPDEQLSPILLIEAPRFLFPFVRSIIANATRDGGFPPLMIQPVDFVDLYRQQLKAQQEAEASTPAKTSASTNSKAAANGKEPVKSKAANG